MYANSSVSRISLFNRTSHNEKKTLIGRGGQPKQPATPIYHQAKKSSKTFLQEHRVIVKSHFLSIFISLCKIERFVGDNLSYPKTKAQKLVFFIIKIFVRKRKQISLKSKKLILKVTFVAYFC